MRSLPLVYLSFSLLVACGPKDTKADKAKTSAAPADISLRATTAFETPDQIIAASFVPNLTASWFSQIIMVDKNGDLHRTVTSGLRSQLLQKGSYKDVYGLSRKADAGAFLALKNDGGLEAFIEIDDEGNFKRVPLSSASNNIKSFCPQSLALPLSEGGDIIWAVDNEGKLHKLKLSISNNEAITLQTLKVDGSFPSVTACSLNEDQTPVGLRPEDKGEILNYEPSLDVWSPARFSKNVTHLKSVPDSENRDYITNNNGASTLQYRKDGQTLNIEIIDGLSIKGIKAPGYISLTAAQLGGALNNGVLLVTDSQSPYIALISRDYMMRELTKTP